MTPIYVFEDSQVERLYPLTLSRPAFLLRCGTMTLLERMEQVLAAAGRTLAGVLVRDGLAETVRRATTVPVNPGVATKDGVILLNGRWLMMQPWDEPLEDYAGIVSDAVVWMRLSAAEAGGVDLAAIHDPRTLEAVLGRMQRTTAAATLVNWPWDLLSGQRAALEADFAHFGPANEATLVVPGTVHGVNPGRIHLAKGVKVWPGVVLDAMGGPIVVEAETEIRANAVLTGPVYVGPHCVVRTGAEIREETTIGPGCKVGGEVIGSILQGHSSKQHYGFLGQSLLGEWVNLGAGTTTSNLKNTYGTVRVPINGVEVSTERQFMGSVIGDHAKVGIGVYLSTGSVVGFASHVLASRPGKFVPSFAWVESDKVVRIEFAKVEAIARMVMARRGVEFGPADHELFVRIAGQWATAEKYEWK